MSRVRIIWNQGGAVYTGRRAVKQLIAITTGNYLTVPLPNPYSSWRHAIAAENALRKAGHLGVESNLLIFREPRRTRTKNSRYKQTLRTLGIWTLGTPAPPRNRPRAVPVPRQKQKRASRTVAMLEQDLLRRAEF